MERLQSIDELSDLAGRLSESPQLQLPQIVIAAVAAG